MRELPLSDLGTPDHRSATRYLWWIVRTQVTTVVGGVVLGVTWMVSQALVPAVIGQAINAGVLARDRGALLAWTGVLLGLGVIQAVSGIMRHRFAVTNWLVAAYRTLAVTVRQAGRLGATLPDRMAAGEVVSIGTSDINPIGNAIDITARGVGSIVAIIVVAIILLNSSLPLGLVVVLGVPVLLTIVAILIRPLHARQQAYREQTGRLTGRAADIVTGLRVLRGVGGESTFARRYQEESQRVRAAGIGVARVESILEAAQVFLPGVFVALVTWLGARFAVSGRITVGELIAFYGYAAFLLLPLRTLTETADKLTRGHVAARRVVAILGVAPNIGDPDAPQPAPDPSATELIDPESGVVIGPGRFTAVAAADPAEATAVVDRLGRYTDSAAHLGGVALADLALSTVRGMILVADNDARLFSGVLREELTGGQPRSDDTVRDALWAANATDIIDALPRGLDTVVTERGREFSGGQQQRLRLARALLHDPSVLILVEPTSAVDAHTEARIGQRLGPSRSGRTTVVCSTSPLILDHADHVCYLEGGRVVAQGRHRDLLDTHPAYAATVTRGEDE